MRFFGGKQRIAKQIAGFLNTLDTSLDYYEPFCGANNLVPYLNYSANYYLSDICEDLILLHKFIQAGGIPIDNLSREEYKVYKTAEASAMRGFVGFGCSFAGKWFGGYASNKRERNYASDAKNSLIKKWGMCQGKNINFSCKSYLDVFPENSVVYLDPPYANTTSYGYSGKFDSNTFWNWARHISKNNQVFISEYTAPLDFETVLEINTKTEIRTKTGRADRIEKLFRLK